MFNKNGKEIGYLRFSMWDKTSESIYHIFNVQEFNGIVSGRGEQKTFFKQDVQQAIERYHQTEIKHLKYENDKMTAWRRREFDKFMNSCETAIKHDGEVTIYFG